MAWLILITGFVAGQTGQFDPERSYVFELKNGEKLYAVVKEHNETKGELSLELDDPMRMEGMRRRTLREGDYRSSRSESQADRLARYREALRHTEMMALESKSGPPVVIHRVEAELASRARNKALSLEEPVVDEAVAGESGQEGETGTVEGPAADLAGATGNREGDAAGENGSEPDGRGMRLLLAGGVLLMGLILGYVVYRMTGRGQTPDLNP